MIIDLTDIETNNYIDTEGEHLLRVIDVKNDRYTNNGNQILEVLFQNKEKVKHKEDFFLTDKAKFRLKLLTKALKMPNMVDTDEMIDRFVIANIQKKEVEKRDGSKMAVFEVVSWKPSKLTNTLTEIRTKINKPKIETEKEEIPF
jgi:hypothetical protein